MNYYFYYYYYLLFSQNHNYLYFTSLTSLLFSYPFKEDSSQFIIETTLLPSVELDRWISVFSISILEISLFFKDFDICFALRVFFFNQFLWMFGFIRESYCCGQRTDTTIDAKCTNHLRN